VSESSEGRRAGQDFVAAAAMTAKQAILSCSPDEPLLCDMLSTLCFSLKIAHKEVPQSIVSFLFVLPDNGRYGIVKVSISSRVLQPMSLIHI
jgi:hypothetical protein